MVLLSWIRCRLRPFPFKRSSPIPIRIDIPKRLAGLRIGIIAPALTAYMLMPAGLAQTCPANVPHIQGTWRTLPYLMPINPISATLLHTGKVLIVAGSENDASNLSAGAESYRNAIWDPTGTTQSSITTYNLNYDVFCSGTVALPDGRTIIIGGASSYGASSYAFTGDNRASIFDPANQTFIRSQSMVDGRWYATATALGDGRVATLSGLKSGGGTNNTVEIYDLKNAGAGWTSPVAAPFTAPPLYPRMFLLPNGKLFFTGQGTDPAIANGWIMDPATATWTQSLATTQDREYGSSVLAATTAAELHAEGDQLRRRQSRYPDNRDHRPFRRVAELDAGAEHVNPPYSDECGHSAQRQGVGGRWLRQ